MKTASEYCKAWRLANPEKNRKMRRNSNLKKEFGITLEDYNKMFAEQKGYCAICKIHQLNTTQKRLVVDHDHKINKIRGFIM
jgi:hypothetical protein